MYGAIKKSWIGAWIALLAATDVVDAMQRCCWHGDGYEISCSLVGTLALDL